jgi:DNA-binding transcriptional regulator YiaG
MHRMLLAAMPFCHLGVVACKPKNNSYLWKASQYPAHPRHIAEQIKKRRFDLKMPAVECRKILGVDKSTLTRWEQGRHEPNLKNGARILKFLGGM